MVELCPTCGQPKFYPQIKGLTKLQSEIYGFISNHPGSTIWQIIDGVYNDRGRKILSDTKVVHVHIHNINKRLIVEGFRIVSSGGRGSIYSIRKIEE